MSTMPTQTFRVWVAHPDSTEPPAFHEVTVRHVDRVSAETAAIGWLPLGQSLTDFPVTMTTAWTWAALRRLKLYSGPLARFLETDCQELESVEETEVDPTRPSPPTDSPSPSPSDSGAPPTTG